MTRFRATLFVVAALAWTISATAGEPLKVFAAASLSESMGDISVLWVKEGGLKPMFNFHSSGSLARQILEGAPADVFITADEAAMDWLDQAGLLAEGTRLSLLSNTLAVVTLADAASTPTKPADLTRLGRLAIGDPATVPAGAYAKTWLAGMALWRPLVDRLVPCDNVRAVLAAVESGNVDAGIVYRTDAIVGRGIKVAFEVPMKEGPAISYPLAALKEARDPAEARRFVEFLKGPTSAAVFKARGFILLAPGNGE